MTLLNDIINDRVEIIDLSVHDLDDESNTYAHAIEKNVNASQLLLSLCDFNDHTFELLINAIIKRKNKFLFIDISANDLLTEKSYNSLIMLIKSKKVEELNIGNLTNVIADKNKMEELANLASINNIVIYVDDKSRSKLHTSCDNSLIQHSMFKPRSCKEISVILLYIFCEKSLFNSLLPKLSRYMVYSLNDAIQKVYSNLYEVKEEKNQGVNYDSLAQLPFENPKITEKIIDELQLFVRFKILDICLSNKLHKDLNFDFLPTSSNSSFKI
jgi:hypothetical protein